MRHCRQWSIKPPHEVLKLMAGMTKLTDFVWLHVPNYPKQDVVWQICRYKTSIGWSIACHLDIEFVAMKNVCLIVSMMCYWRIRNSRGARRMMLVELARKKVVFGSWRKILVLGVWYLYSVKSKGYVRAG